MSVPISDNNIRLLYLLLSIKSDSEIDIRQKINVVKGQRALKGSLSRPGTQSREWVLLRRLFKEVTPELSLVDKRAVSGKGENRNVVQDKCICTSPGGCVIWLVDRGQVLGDMTEAGPRHGGFCVYPVKARSHKQGVMLSTKTDWSFREYNQLGHMPKGNLWPHTQLASPFLPSQDALKPLTSTLAPLLILINICGYIYTNSVVLYLFLSQLFTHMVT